MQEICLQITKSQKAIENKDALLVENEANILSLEGDVQILYDLNNSSQMYELRLVS